MLPVPLAGIDRSRECLFEVNQVIFEDLNETRQQMGGHPSSTTSRLNLMRLRDVLALDPRFAVRSGRIFAPSRRYRSRHHETTRSSTAAGGARLRRSEKQQISAFHPSVALAMIAPNC